MTEGELVLYTAEDGSVSIQLRAEGGAVWITQAEMAALFQTTPQNITLHVKAIYAEDELQQAATCKKDLQVRQEGSRQANRRMTMTMRDWADKLDEFLPFNERETLTHAGKLRADTAEKLALEHYESFDAARRKVEASAQNEADIAQLVEMEKAAKKSRITGGGDA